MRNETELLENKELRNEMANRVEVLEKVKSLLLIPNTDKANLKQVAEFYEVEEDTIKKSISRNEDELLLDGMLKLSGKETKEFLVRDNLSPTNFRGYFEVEGIKFANNSNMLFPRRAILRIGMLLRDSAIAKEVRTQLLNIEEKTTNETKVADITEEQSLALALGMAQASGDITAITIATGNLMSFKNRHIERLKQDNKALAGEILKWEDRSQINFAVRKFAKLTHTREGYVWNNLYKELQYKHHINVKLRGSQPFIQHIKENEWDKVIKSFAALCEKENISPSDILNKVTVEV